MIRDLVCKLFGHKPRGPLANVSMQRPEDGAWIPIYGCARCCRGLWFSRIDGWHLASVFLPNGWEAGNEEALRIERDRIAAQRKEGV